MRKLLVYLDNCCFNRPFDDQGQLRIRLESEAKLYVQNLIRSGKLDLLWSFVLEYEVQRIPAIDRRTPILLWRDVAVKILGPDESIKRRAQILESKGLKPMDALHLSCGIEAGCFLFFTTDKGILKKRDLCPEIVIINPVDYIENQEAYHD